jgi:hypothetical protein
MNLFKKKGKLQDFQVFREMKYYNSMYELNETAIWGH